MQNHLVDWLRDAHGMEVKSREILEKQARRLESYPEFRMRVERHLEETERQAERIRNRLDAMNGGQSVMKALFGNLAGNLGAVMNAMSSDEVVKNVLGDYAVENFEIASYKSLIAAARRLGDEETARICEENLREEEAMAVWIDEHIPAITEEFLSREAAGVQSKR